jgi:cell division septation protein DedD
MDIVAVGGLTEGVFLKPLACSVSLVLRGLLQRVVLVDCDLRAPSLHTVIGTEAKEGFIDMVKYGCSFFTAAVETETEGIYVIPAGSHPVSSEEELRGRELERVFHSLRAKADMTLVCMRPFLSAGRVNPIAEHVDAMLLCVHREEEYVSAIGGDVAKLWKSDVPVIGIISQSSAEAVESEVAPSEEVYPADTHEPEGKEPAEESPTEEIEIVDATLFGKRAPRSKLPLVVGICVAVVVVGFLIVSKMDLFAPKGPVMDSRTTRSILLPGADGVTNAVEEDAEIAGSVSGGIGSLDADAEPVGTEPTIPGSAGEEAAQPGPQSGQEALAPALEKASSPSSVPAVEGEGRMSLRQGEVLVHVSSFRNYERAAKDSARIAAAGLKTSIAFVRFEDLGSWYRVLVGPFEGRADAEEAASRLMSLGLAKNVRVISEGGTP